MNTRDLLIYSLRTLRIKFTKSYFNELWSNNIQADNLLGITRMLGIYGVQSQAVRIDDVNDLKELDTPFIMQYKDKDFLLVTEAGGEELTVFKDVQSEKLTYGSVADNMENFAVMLHSEEGACEPDYRKHRMKDLESSLVWALPALWFVWALASICLSGATLPCSFLFTAIALSSLGLYLCILLHRQWTGDSNAVEHVCSLFKSSNCAASHSTFFFNRWFDLSEVGAAYFLTILIYLCIAPEKGYSAAWMILPSLPATLWNLYYQFIRKKSWCPLCVSVQLLLWIIAIACWFTGAYSLERFVLIDFISCCLIWGAVLAVILKFVTPSVKRMHEAEQAKVALATFKGRKEVMEALDMKFEKGIRKITIAVSPTCAYCKAALEYYEQVLESTGRFELEKKYYPVHDGDSEKIRELIGEEAANEHLEWCKSHDIKATPTIFVNGRLLNDSYNIANLLYI